MDAHFFRAFAHPYTVDTDGAYDTMLYAYLSAIGSRLHKTLQSPEAGTDWYEDAVPPPPDSPEALAAAWMPELGRALHLLDAGNAAAAYLQYLLALSCLDVTGTWRAELAQAADLFCAGHSLAVDGAVTIISREGSIEIEHGKGVLTRLSNQDGAWICTGSRSLSRLLAPLSSALGQRQIYTCAGELVDLAPKLHGRANAWIPAQTASTIMNIVDLGFSFIESDAPEYLPWVEKVVRGILVVRGNGKFYEFGSHKMWPGLVIVDDYVDPVLAAEILVHEASHQHYALISTAFPPINGADDNEYYSPFMKKERPLERILIAYHSAVNMGLFYVQALRKENARRAQYKKNLDELLDEIQQLGAPLAQTNGLTEAGEVMWRSLDECLQSLLAA
jgi:HEXXH motif-containing protein